MSEITLVLGMNGRAIQILPIETGEPSKVSVALTV